MRCVICKSGELKPGHTTVTLERNGSVVVIKDVPAKVCDNCGHYYLNDTMTTKVYHIAEETIASGVEVEVRHLVALG
ncbi:MAG: type II toxin-antitoxin system MqsA family antitoxin [Cyclobacteriaceae bacterium]